MQSCGRGTSLVPHPRLAILTPPTCLPLSSPANLEEIF